MTTITNLEFVHLLLKTNGFDCHNRLSCLQQFWVNIPRGNMFPFQAFSIFFSEKGIDLTSYSDINFEEGTCRYQEGDWKKANPLNEPIEEYLRRSVGFLEKFIVEVNKFEEKHNGILHLR